MSNKLRLNNKTAIVTGGASGIGEQIVRHFVAEGCKVAIFDKNINGLKLEKELNSNGYNSKYYKCDVTDENSIVKCVNESIQYLGALNILVNNAGIGKAGNILTTDNNDWDEIIKVNLTGTYLVTKYSLEKLINSKNGSIVNIASVAGIVAVKDRFAYCTSKGGVISLTKSIALDFVKENVRANAICPGTVNTPWVERITQDYDNPDEARDLMRQRQPLGRLGEPEEIAQAAIYLGSDESKFITGTTLVIDGGLTMA
tara:strand:+ start:794 stop:1564 length:771 start_codon:yes stop_codon:yes gene_type:complete